MSNSSEIIKRAEELNETVANFINKINEKTEEQEQRIENSLNNLKNYVENIEAKNINAQEKYTYLIDLREESSDKVYPFAFLNLHSIEEIEKNENLEIYVYRLYSWDNLKIWCGLDAKIRYFWNSWSGNVAKLQKRLVKQTFDESIALIANSILCKTEKLDKNKHDSKYNTSNTKIDNYKVNSNPLKMGFFLRGGRRYTIISNKKLDYTLAKQETIITENTAENVKFSLVPFNVKSISFEKNVDNL